MPNVSPNRVIEDIRLAGENNVMAMFLDMVWEHWANHGPHYYMLAQMAWNPNADGEAILEDYYQRAFGPAADAMTKYWELMEKTSDEIVFEKRPQAEVWDADFYQVAYAYLDQAQAEVADGPEIYQQRLDFVRAGLDYMRLHYENRDLIASMKESLTGDQDAMAIARSNWQEILQIFEEHPYAFNALYVSPGRARADAANPDAGHLEVDEPDLEE